MKFQCYLCQSVYNAEMTELDESKSCPSCNRQIVVPRRPFDAGRVIGDDYVIQKTIGAGGMGSVYLARQRSLDRDVALKVLLRKFSIDAKFRKEFLSEAQSVSSLIHGNLVQMFSFGEDDGDLYLAMEYVDGITMGDRLEKTGHLDPDDALNIVQQVAEGLHCAWENASLIHRDIKPDNIMLGASGWVKLTDMGLARRQEDLANVKEISGTPAYMNPEQFRNDPMDCRADIYSLGVVLYHAVVGRLPFQSTSVKELARQHLFDQLVFNDKTVDVPSDIKRLIQKMMSKDREERHKNYEELIRDVIRIRQRLVGPEQSVPGMHTISMNKMQFRQMRLEKKKESGIGSIDELPRQRLRALADDIYSRSLTLQPREESFWKVMLSRNMVAIVAVVIALGAAVTVKPPVREYEKAAASFKDKYDSESFDAEETLLELNALLDSFPAKAPARSMALKAELLEVKASLLERLEQLEMSRRNELEKELRLARVSNIQVQKQLSSLNEEAEERIREFRAAYLEQAFASITNEGDKKVVSPSDALPFSWDDAQALNLLWLEKKRNLINEVFALGRAQLFDKALAGVVTEKKTFSGTYKDFLLRLEEALSQADEFHNELIEGLPELSGAAFSDFIDEQAFPNLKEGEVKRAYPLTQEIEMEDGTIYKLNELTLQERLYLAGRLGMTQGEQGTLGASYYALFQQNFVLSRELTPENAFFSEVLDIYIEDRLWQIARMVDRRERVKAIENAQQLLNGMNNFKRDDSEVRQRLEALLGPNWNSEQTP